MTAFPPAIEPSAPEPWQPAGRETQSQIEGLAAEMALRWQRGERPLAEEFFARQPELWARPEAALELIAEELALRQETGLGVDPDELQERFPQWRRQVEILARCHDLLAVGRLPAVGETLGDFRLLAELGRGAVSRAYLATQPSLAGRPVVLKLSRAPSGEHLSLARLQHTHIVPLFSVHKFPAHGLSGLCQPYLGGTTLAALLDGLRDLPPAQRTGADLLSVLQNAQAPEAPLPGDGPACRFLAHASYVEAVCWIGMCLAEALQYAHERDLLHLDVKPSNVLLAADGQPLLLDFHLARPSLPAATLPRMLGGTPRYMAPEHRKALHAVRERRAIPESVDGRADVYSLALVMAEALGGELPTPSESASALRIRNPRVTTGLADLLAKCLAPEPRLRYRTAGELAADLRRYLADLPLRGVRNRSVTESWRRWRRRRPHALLGFCLSTGMAAGAVLLGYTTARPPGVSDAGRRAECAESARELHESCEQMRALYGIVGSSPTQAQEVENLCARLWRNRERIQQSLGGLSTAELEEQMRTDLLDVAILWSDLHVRLAVGEEVPRARQEALEVLAQAEALFGPNCVLSAEKCEHQRALGLAAPDAESPAARTAWEYYALGRFHLRTGDTTRAADDLNRALSLQPQSLWANFYRGRCAVQTADYEDGVAAFSACVALAPTSAWPVYHRGLAEFELGRLDRARNDLRRVLALKPGHEQARRLLAELDQRARLVPR